jgi:hypothetical protein
MIMLLVQNAQWPLMDTHDEDVRGAGPGQRRICARLPSTTTIKLLTCHIPLFML